MGSFSIATLEDKTGNVAVCHAFSMQQSSFEIDRFVIVEEKDDVILLDIKPFEERTTLARASIGIHFFY
ncbi:hypothetical protein TMatcc_002341 [Talaromyces marneffei ATCC 18224]